MRRTDRLADHVTVSTSLAVLSDRQLSELVASATPLGASIGGETLRLEIADTPVFVKKIALTDRERDPGDLRSTANLFELPGFYQYGVGSAGFGAWRELAVHETTTAWVLGGACHAFPLTYHWRVLPAAPPVHHDDVDAATSYWDGSVAVRRRLTAIQEATASIVVFMEHFPQTLAQLLNSAEVDYRAIGGMLEDVTSFLGSQGVVHFDAHFDNFLSDGERVYLTDFGLASSTRFDLSDSERGFLAAHASYDHCVTMANLVNAIITAEVGTSSREHRNAVVRDCADGVLPESCAAIVRDHAPMAAVANDFFYRLRTRRRTVPYPAEDIADRIHHRRR